MWGMHIQAAVEKQGPFSFDGTYTSLLFPLWCCSQIFRIRVILIFHMHSTIPFHHSIPLIPDNHLLMIILCVLHQSGFTVMIFTNVSPSGREICDEFVTMAIDYMPCSGVGK